MMVAMPSTPPTPARRLSEPEVARVLGVLPVWLDPMSRHLRLPAPVGARNGVRQWNLDAVKAWLQWRELSRPAPQPQGS